MSRVALPPHDLLAIYVLRYMGLETLHNALAQDSRELLSPSNASWYFGRVRWKVILCPASSHTESTPNMPGRTVSSLIRVSQWLSLFPPFPRSWYLGLRSSIPVA